MIARILSTLGLLALAPTLWAAGAIEGEVQRQPLNVSAIVMFVAFVGFTLCITYWASKRSKSAADFYTAGGGITGFQNGLAIAGDYMSAASFLGISALVFASGYDGLIYSIGFLVGWPIILFLIAERLRNLGKYTFADVASFRLKPDRDPHPFCQRYAGGGGLLPDRADGRCRQADRAAVRPRLPRRGDPGRYPDGLLRAVRRHAGHHLGTDHQGRAAAVRRLLHGAYGDEARQLRLRHPVQRSGEGPPEGRCHHEPRRPGDRPDLGDLPGPGADVRYRRPAAHPDALLHRVRRQGSPQERVLRHRLHRLLLHPDLHHRLRRDPAGRHQPASTRTPLAP